MNSPSRFRNKLYDYITEVKKDILKRYSIDFSFEEIGDLLISVCRSNDFGVMKYQNDRMFLDEEKFWSWVDEKLIPNTITVNLGDEDIVRLLIFCIEITYQMFGGGTKATITQKGFRQRRRTFESILVDQFVGKLGEIFVKKFLEKNYSARVELDWEISTQIERYRNDIVNAVRNVSIKSSPTLAGVWAEADLGYDYGIMVKCSVPQQPILQFFIEVCGFARLLDFAEERIPQSNGLFRSYLNEIRNRVKAYKCGDMQTVLKGFVCGYFKTSEYSPTPEGSNLPYLGLVREERYLVPINELKWTKNEWSRFVEEVEIS